MTFDTRRGTRGGHQPGGRLLRLGNQLMSRLVRRSRDGRMLGFSVALLTTVGRRTGAERTNPVGFFPAPDGNRLVVASANGAADNPAWYYNLAADPHARIEIGHRVEDVTARQLHGAEREQAWQQIVAVAPHFARYQKRTDRELPVIRLESRTRSRGL